MGAEKKLRVVCGPLEAQFDYHEGTFLVTSPGQHQGQRLSGTAFEKAAGLGTAKKWKNSVRVDDGGPFHGKRLKEWFDAQKAQTGSEAKAKAAASKQAAQADQLQQDGDKAIAAGERGRSQQGQEGVTPLTKRRALGDNTTTVTVVGGVHLGNSWWFRDKTGVEKGPVAVEVLREALASGSLTSDEYVTHPWLGSLRVHDLLNGTNALPAAPPTATLPVPTPAPAPALPAPGNQEQAAPGAGPVAGAAVSPVAEPQQRALPAHVAPVASLLTAFGQQHQQWEHVPRVDVLKPFMIKCMNTLALFDPLLELFLVKEGPFAGQRLDGVALENAAGKTWPKKWKASCKVLDGDTDLIGKPVEAWFVCYRDQLAAARVKAGYEKPTRKELHRLAGAGPKAAASPAGETSGGSASSGPVPVARGPDSQTHTSQHQAQGAVAAQAGAVPAAAGQKHSVVAESAAVEGPVPAPVVPDKAGSSAAAAAGAPGMAPGLSSGGSGGKAPAAAAPPAPQHATGAPAPQPHTRAPKEDSVWSGATAAAPPEGGQSLGQVLEPCGEPAVARVALALEHAAGRGVGKSRQPAAPTPSSAVMALAAAAPSAAGGAVDMELYDELEQLLDASALAQLPAARAAPPKSAAPPVALPAQHAQQQPAASGTRSGAATPAAATAAKATPQQAAGRPASHAATHGRQVNPGGAGDLPHPSSLPTGMPAASPPPPAPVPAPAASRSTSAAAAAAAMVAVAAEPAGVMEDDWMDTSLLDDFGDDDHEMGAAGAAAAPHLSTSLAPPPLATGQAAKPPALSGPAGGVPGAARATRPQQGTAGAGRGGAPAAASGLVSIPGLGLTTAAATAMAGAAPSQPPRSPLFARRILAGAPAPASPASGSGPSASGLPAPANSTLSSPTAARAPGPSGSPARTTVLITSKRQREATGPATSPLAPPPGTAAASGLARAGVPVPVRLVGSSAVRPDATPAAAGASAAGAKAGDARGAVDAVPREGTSAAGPGPITKKARWESTGSEQSDMSAAASKGYQTKPKVQEGAGKGQQQAPAAAGGRPKSDAAAGVKPVTKSVNPAAGADKVVRRASVEGPKHNAGTDGQAKPSSNYKYADAFVEYELQERARQRLKERADAKGRKEQPAGAGAGAGGAAGDISKAGNGKGAGPGAGGKSASGAGGGRTSQQGTAASREGIKAAGKGPAPVSAATKGNQQHPAKAPTPAAASGAGTSAGAAKQQQQQQHAARGSGGAASGGGVGAAGKPPRPATGAAPGQKSAGGPKPGGTATGSAAKPGAGTAAAAGGAGKGVAGAGAAGKPGSGAGGAARPAAGAHGSKPGAPGAKPPAAGGAKPKGPPKLPVASKRSILDLFKQVDKDTEKLQKEKEKERRSLGVAADRYYTANKDDDDMCDILIWRDANDMQRCYHFDEGVVKGERGNDFFDVYELWDMVTDEAIKPEQLVFIDEEGHALKPVKQVLEEWRDFIDAMIEFRDTGSMPRVERMYAAMEAARALQPLEPPRLPSPLPLADAFGLPSPMHQRAGLRGPEGGRGEVEMDGEYGGGDEDYSPSREAELRRTPYHNPNDSLYTYPRARAQSQQQGQQQLQQQVPGGQQMQPAHLAGLPMGMDHASLLRVVLSKIQASPQIQHMLQMQEQAAASARAAAQAQQQQQAAMWRPSIAQQLWAQAHAQSQLQAASQALAVQQQQQQAQPVLGAIPAQALVSATASSQPQQQTLQQRLSGPQAAGGPRPAGVPPPTQPATAPPATAAAATPKPQPRVAGEGVRFKPRGSRQLMVKVLPLHHFLCDPRQAAPPQGGDDGVPAHLLELESRLEEDEDADLRTGHQERDDDFSGDEEEPTPTPPSTSTTTSQPAPAAAAANPAGIGAGTSAPGPSAAATRPAAPQQPPPPPGLDLTALLPSRAPSASRNTQSHNAGGQGGSAAGAGAGHTVAGMAGASTATGPAHDHGSGQAPHPPPPPPPAATTTPCAATTAPAPQPTWPPLPPGFEPAPGASNAQPRQQSLLAPFSPSQPPPSLPPSHAAFSSPLPPPSPPPPDATSTGASDMDIDEKYEKYEKYDKDEKDEKGVGMQLDMGVGQMEAAQPDDGGAMDGGLLEAAFGAIPTELQVTSEDEGPIFDELARINGIDLAGDRNLAVRLLQGLRSQNLILVKFDNLQYG